MGYYDEDERGGAGADLAEQIAALRARVAELEERVAQLETQPRPAPANSRPASSAPTATAPAPDRTALVEALSQALAQVGEGDAGALRQHLIKSGGWADLARSDVNKVLYAHPDRFQVARQEGAKPIWKAV